MINLTFTGETLADIKQQISEAYSEMATTVTPKVEIQPELPFPKPEVTKSQEKKAKSLVAKANALVDKAVAKTIEEITLITGSPKDLTEVTETVEAAEEPMFVEQAPTDTLGEIGVPELSNRPFTKEDVKAAVKMVNAEKGLSALVGILNELGLASASQLQQKHFGKFMTEAAKIVPSITI